MADLAINEGDALSRLIKMHANRHDIRLTWSGNGATDLIALCNAHAVKARMTKHLWNGMRELMQMPEMKETPEAIQAQIVSIILKAQVLVDLDNEDHAKRLVHMDRPKSPL